jgi:NAD dependent epimerase/dehydratase family enzyme
MHRPAWFTTPAAAVKVALGSEASMVVTTGQRVVPRRAQELGYVFQYPSLVPALASILTP